MDKDNNVIYYNFSKTLTKKNKTFEAINERCLKKNNNFSIVFQIRKIGDITEYMGFDNGLPIYTTPYHKAVIENDIQKLHSLLVPPSKNHKIINLHFKKEGVNLNIIDYAGFSPLLYAVEYEQYEIIHLLLVHGADPFFCSLGKASSIILALQGSSHRIFTLLLKKCSINALARNIYNFSLFCSLEKKQSYGQNLKLLLEHIPAPENINIAIQADFPKIAKSLMNKDYVINYQNFSNVMWNQNIDLLKYLIKQSQSPIDCCIDNPLKYAIEYAKLDGISLKVIAIILENLSDSLAKLIRKNPEWKIIFHCAAYKRNSKYLKAIIEAYFSSSEVANLNEFKEIINSSQSLSCDSGSLSTLEYAISIGCRENVELLLKYGADLEAIRKKYNFSFIKRIDEHLIYKPIKNDNVVCLELMQDCELNLKFHYPVAFSFEDENPLHFAIQEKSLNCARFLLNHYKNSEQFLKKEIDFNYLKAALSSANKQLIDFVIDNSLVKRKITKMDMKKYFTADFKKSFKNLPVDVFKHLIIKYPKFINYGNSIYLAQTIIDAENYDLFEFLAENYPSIVELGNCFNIACWYSYRCYNKNNNIMKILQYCLKRIEVNGKDTREQTPLYSVLNYKDVPLEVLKNLIERGADVNAKDNKGNTLLLYCISSLGEKTDYLLKHTKVDLTAVNNEGNSLLHLITRTSDQNKFSSALFKKALNAGVDINLKNKAGRTPLFFAAQYSLCIDNVKYLHKLGANLNVIDNEGNSLLNVALTSETIEYVLKHSNISLKYQNRLGDDVFCSLSKCLNIRTEEKIQFFEKHAYSINSKLFNDDYPILLYLKDSCEGTTEFLMELILEYELDISVRNKEGNTILLCGEKYYNIPFVLDLYKHNIIQDFDTTNNKGQNILHITFAKKEKWQSKINGDWERKSTEKNIIELVSLLKEKNFNFNQKDNNGKTPLDCLKELKCSYVEKAYKHGLKTKFHETTLYQEHQEILNKQFQDPNYFTGTFNFSKILTAIYYLSRKYSKEEIANILNTKDNTGITSLLYQIKQERSYEVEYSSSIRLLQKYGALIPEHQLLSATEEVVKNNLNPLQFTQLKNHKHMILALQYVLEYKKIKLAKLLLAKISMPDLSCEDKSGMLLGALLGDKVSMQFILRHKLIPNVNNNEFNDYFVKHQEIFFTKVKLGAFKIAISKIDGFKFFITNPILNDNQLYYGLLERFCYFKNFPLVKYLIEELKFNVNERLNNTPLITSIEQQIESDGISEYLISKGADVNLRSDYLESSPLALVLTTNQRPTYNLLIKKDADTQALDFLTYNPLMHALLYITNISFNDKGACNGSILEDFIGNHNPNLSIISDSEDTILHTVAGNANIPLENRVIKDLIENTIKAGVDINLKNKNLETPLFKSIEYNNEKVFFMLVSLGADVNLSVTEDNLHPLCYVRNKKIWDFYLSQLNLSQVELEDIFYHYCNYNSYLPINNDWELILDYFLAHGFKINHRFKDGNTPILVVAKAKNRFSKIEFIELLISRGADINDIDNEGNTAAMLFVQYLYCSQGNITLILNFLEKYQKSIKFKHKNMFNKNICDSLTLNKSVTKNWNVSKDYSTLLNKKLNKNWHVNISFPNNIDNLKKFF